MKKVAVLSLLFMLQSGLSYAADETYLESNKEDVRCEWKSPSNSGKGICHIIQQGTQMGETIESFRLGNNPEIFTISDREKPTISIEEGPNKDWKTIWKGKLLKDNWKETSRYHAIETIKLSNGYTIILYR